MSLTVILLIFFAILTALSALFAWMAWIFLQAMRGFLDKHKMPAATAALGGSAIFGMGAVFCFYMASKLLGA